jgi:hypothetical protein
MLLAKLPSQYRHKLDLDNLRGRSENGGIRNRVLTTEGLRRELLVGHK